MTNLSPAAQAVHDAFWSHPNGKPLVQDCPDTDQLVAALRAAADQSHPRTHIEDIDYVHQSYVDGWKDALDVILGIADELEALANG